MGASNTANQKELFMEPDEFFPFPEEYKMEGDELCFFTSEGQKELDLDDKNKRKRHHHKLLLFIIPFVILMYTNAMKMEVFENPKFSTRTVSHMVQKGDTLWSIALQYMGSGKNYLLIALENDVQDPHWIYPGQLFHITIRQELQEDMYGQEP